MKTHSGYIAILGEPNAGKSTLLNSILKEKISIVTHKAQTTRKKMPGIYTFENYQLVFLDAPGVHSSEKKLNQFMHGEIMSVIKDADILLWLFDATIMPSDCVLQLYKSLNEIQKAKTQIIVRTKIDLLGGREPCGEKVLSQIFDIEKFIGISAKTGEGIVDLLEVIKWHLPLGPFYYEANELTDRHLREMVGEIIREKCLLFLHDEIPYSLAVVIEKFKEEKDMTRIMATLIIEHESQKGIVIGEGGRTVKKIGMEARREMEKLLDQKVFLQMNVKVDKNWTKDDNKLREYGYGLERH